MAISLAILVLLGGLAISAQKDAAMRALASEGRRLEVLVDSVDRTREPLHGEGAEGLASDEYEAALEGLDSNVAEDWVAYRQAFEAGDVELLERGRALLAKNQGCLEALRRGAHASDAKWTWTGSGGLAPTFRA